MTSQSHLTTGSDDPGWVGSVHKRLLNAAGLASLATQEAEGAK